MFFPRSLNWKVLAGLLFGAALLIVVFRSPFSVRSLVPFLFALACPVGMGLMMWLMMRGMGNMGDTSMGQSTQTPTEATDVPLQSAPALTRRERVTQLQAELAALQDESPDLDHANATISDAPTPANTRES